MASFLSCPDEILLHILHYLDIPDLYILTLTNHQLRTLSTDPLLHRHRLRRAFLTLNQHLPRLPPPPPPIFYTPRQYASRSLSRKFASLSLKRKLQSRPDVPTLISRGVLPEKLFRKDTSYPDPVVAPRLLSAACELEKSRIKDVVRRLVVRRRSLEETAEREGWVDPSPAEGARVRVRDLVRRYAGCERRREGESRWGSGRSIKWDPPRAKVLGLRRVYESLVKGCGV